MENRISKKQSHQFKALVIKNIKIQARQPCTNICQIITPIICLLFTTLIRNVAISKIPNDNDSIFKQFPLIPQKFGDYSLEDMFPDLVYRDCAQWYNFEAKNKSDMGFIGTNDGLGHRSGMLGRVPKTYPSNCYFNFSRIDDHRYSFYQTPMFRTKNESVNELIMDTILFFNELPYDEVKHSSTIHKMPDGSVTFFEANKDRLLADLKIDDSRVFEYHRSDGITKIQFYVEKLDDFKSFYQIPEGFLSMQHLVTRAYIEEATPDHKKVGGGIIYMPFQPTPSAFVDVLVGTVTTIIFPLSLSLLLPVFLYLVVLEKEERLIQMMRMNGMKMHNYWLVNFIFNLGISLLTNLVFFGFGYLFMDISFFRNTGGLVLFVVLFGWVLVQIGMATFFQVFLHSSRAANIIGYLISIWTNLIGATLNIAIFQYPRPMPLAYLLYPTFSFNRLFYLMFNACGSDSCFRSIADLPSEAKTCLTIMYSSFFVFQLLGMYLHEVVPQQFGTSQPLTFPIRALIKRFRGSDVHSSVASAQILQTFVNQTSDQAQNNDEQAKHERSKIADIADFSDYALIINGLRKIYSNGKVAVKGMDLIVQDKEVFGLLGPNGAGKTTLISMITGVFSPTEGNCYVGGYSILQDLQEVHLRIGVCPQFDLLWPQLTVEDHFYFYARLRGTPSSLLKQTVEDTLQDVNLTEFRRFRSNQLSGGMKRRLSVGISMVGDPRIVFLDEPTTGLDPQNRRKLWEVLNKCKQRRALFLTTHLMEEADALCNRIGIITNGVLRTLGIQQKLKRMYGKGYHLSVNVEIERCQHLQEAPMENSVLEGKAYESILSEKVDEDPYMRGMDYQAVARRNEARVNSIKKAISAMFPQAVLDREINGFLRFNVGQIVISEAMETLMKSELVELRDNWSLSNSTLEDVFMEVVGKFQEEQDEEEEEGEREGKEEGKEEERGEGLTGRQHSLQHEE